MRNLPSKFLEHYVITPELCTCYDNKLLNLESLGGTIYGFKYSFSLKVPWTTLQLTHTCPKSNIVKLWHAWFNPTPNTLFPAATILLSLCNRVFYRSMIFPMLPSQRNRLNRLDCTCNNKRRRDLQEAANIRGPEEELHRPEAIRLYVYSKEKTCW